MPSGNPVCLGESLAHVEIFLFTSILQNFLGYPSALEAMDLTRCKNGPGRLPPLFQLCFLPQREGRRDAAPASAHNEPVGAL